MVNRVQTLRSAVAGQRPATGSRPPGELYVNWADRQLGVIDAGGAAVDLIAVRYFNAAAAYVAGDLVIFSGQLYKAKAAVTPGAFVPAAWDKYYTQPEVDTLLALKQNIGIYNAVTALAADHTIVAANVGSLLVFTGAHTLTLANVTTPGSRVDVIASTGLVTVTGGTITSLGSKTKISIGGGASLTYLSPGNWHLGGALE